MLLFITRKITRIIDFITSANENIKLCGQQECETVPPEVTSSRTLSTFKYKLKIYLFSRSLPEYVTVVTEVLLHYLKIVCM